MGKQSGSHHLRDLGGIIYIIYIYISPRASYWENMGKQSKTLYPALSLSLSLSLLHSAGLDPTLPHGGAPMGACALVTSSWICMLVCECECVSPSLFTCSQHFARIQFHTL